MSNICFPNPYCTKILYIPLFSDIINLHPYKNIEFRIVILWFIGWWDSRLCDPREIQFLKKSDI